MKKLFVFFIAILLYSTNYTYAQKNFTEGIITYTIYVDGKESGLYIVTLKANNIKRDIVMQSGYSNISIYNSKTGTTTTINNKNGNKYALQLSAEEVKEQNKQFENATYVNLNNKKSIANYMCEHSAVQYTNGVKNEIFFTNELLVTSDNLNTMFPGLNGLPLEYEIKTNNKQSMKFVAKKIEIVGVDNNVFNIPKEYKLITKEQLDKL